jgi:hypothetical protein
MSDPAWRKDSLKALSALGALAPLCFALATTACGSDTEGDRSPAVYPSLDMIDDMEDGDLSIREANGRVGAWQAFNDGTATGTEESAMTAMNPPRMITGSEEGTGRTMSLHGYHVAGGGYSGWGAGWMVDFNTASGAREPYDASNYAGIVFWGKSDGAPTTVKVALPDRYSDAGGGICDPNDTRVGGRGCYDDFAMNIVLGKQWRRYEIAFASVATGNWGLRHQFDTQHVFGIKFSVMPSYAKFDAWVDDVAFYGP